MTIAYFIASPTWGGGEQYVFDLARHMKDCFHIQPYFLFPPDSDANMTARFASIGECVVFSHVGKWSRFLPSSGRLLAKRLDQWGIDVLHINSRQSYITAVFAKRYAQHPFRLVATQHLVRPAKTGLLWNWAYKQIDELVCVSRCVRDVYMQPFRGKKVFPDVQVIYNSAPFTKTISALPKPHPFHHILFHGRICREKGIEPLFKALDQLQDIPFEMTFAGQIDKRFKETWQQLLTSSSVRDRIQYVGFQNDMSRLLNECHIGISPSIVQEAGPLSMLEEMAFGLAIITSNNGSQPEMIKDKENGLLCAPNDAQAIANALRQLLTNEALTQQLGQKAKADFFAKHNYEQFIHKMYQIYTL